MSVYVLQQEIARQLAEIHRAGGAPLRVCIGKAEDRLFTDQYNNLHRFEVNPQTIKSVADVRITAYGLPVCVENRICGIVVEAL